MWYIVDTLKGKDVMSKEVIKHFTLTKFLLILGGIYALIRWRGYIFIPASQPIFGGVMAVMVVLLVVNGVWYSEEQSKLASVSAALLPLSAVLFLFVQSGAVELSRPVFVVLVAVLMGGSMVLFFARTHSTVRKAVLGTIYSVVLLVPTLFMLFFLVFFAGFFDFNHEEVIRSATSPGDVYVAEVIESSQGATGGSTRVYVTYQGSSINLLVGKLQPEPRQVYFGRWGEFYNMRLHWETDEILHINNITLTRRGTRWVQR